MKIPLAAVLSIGAGLAAALLSPRAAASDERVLDPRLHHLGNDTLADWTETTPEAEGARLDIRFEASSNARPFSLTISQRDVDDAWRLVLNGVEIGPLRRAKERVTEMFPVPEGALRDGENVLSIVPERAGSTDDVVVGDIRLSSESIRERLSLRPVRVRVRDAETGRGLPARITITSEPAEAGGKREMSEIYYARSASTAVRQGIVYSAAGDALFELPPGNYRFAATRGMEWGRDVAARAITRDEEGPIVIDLAIRREVDTAGFVACDTHVHTVTFSGHGDASVEERVVTLAGEGVELAVATDHNHHTDYRSAQGGLQLHEHFTSVTGNEVTTDNGHFNAFPLDPAGEVPPFQESDWVKLLDGIRSKGAKVVILNHPRWPEIGKGPFGVFGLDRASGERDGGPERFAFDGMELANSCALLPEPLFLFRDWFALLNYGERVAAVGSSDSHTVGEPVGQGRTYVPSASDDPAKIDVDAACAAFVAGRTSVALGIFTDVRVNGTGRMGDTVAATGPAVRIALRVAAASWVRPEKATVYVNGIAAAEAVVPCDEGKPTDRTLDLEIGRPAHDAHLVCVVTGPGIDDPSWRTSANYTLGATNPVFLDVDGDGDYASPRETARAIVARAGAAPESLAAEFARVDDAVAIQMASLARTAYEAEAREKLRRLAGGASERQPGAREYLERHASGEPEKR